MLDWMFGRRSYPVVCRHCWHYSEIVPAISEGLTGHGPHLPTTTLALRRVCCQCGQSVTARILPRCHR